MSYEYEFAVIRNRTTRSVREDSIGPNKNDVDEQAEQRVTTDPASEENQNSTVSELRITRFPRDLCSMSVNRTTQFSELDNFAASRGARNLKKF